MHFNKIFMWIFISTKLVGDAAMALHIWVLIGLSLVAEGYEFDLKWPSEYTVKATKILLTSNLIEDYQIWKTKNETRVDYNKGAVTSIKKRDKSFRFRKTYNIHPQAFLNQSVYTVCYVSDSGSLHNILPDTESLELVGKEEMRDKRTVKYEYEDTYDDVRVKDTLWAIYNNKKKYWYPVRYESLSFNTKLGFKDIHEIWEFYGFSTTFSKEEVYDVTNYDCKEAPKEEDDCDTETKDLMFIDPEKDDHVDHAFNSFKKSYRKKYADDKEHAFRRRIFQNNMRHIVATNNKNLGYKLAINHFSDRTPKEMKKSMGLRRRGPRRAGTVPFPYTQSQLTELLKDLPKEYDLRLYGLVSSIKDQNDCGSCWAFGTTAAVEGALAWSNGGRLLSLANQALIDCAWAYNVFGCDGGTDTGAYEWMMDYGLPTEAEYGPYKNQNGICGIKNMTKLYPIRGFTNVTPRSVEALKIALINHGPLSVSVHATDAFAMYSSGIFYDPKCVETCLNHEVALVGYGERNGETFWILKNSWGPNWGIDGYMHISAKDNMCGVATEPTFVVF